MTDASEQLIGIVPMSCSFVPCAELEPLAQRAPVLRAAEAVSSVPALTTLVVAGPGRFRDRAIDLLRAVREGPELTPSVRWVTVEAVDPFLVLRRALRRVAPAPRDLILVHDPRQPLVGGTLLATVVDTLRLASAGPGAVTGLPVAGVIPVRPVTDTLKQVRSDGVITGTPDRARYRVVGSPQVYRAQALVSALDRHLREGAGVGEPGAAESSEPATPDAGVGLRLAQAVRRAGHRVLTVPAPVESLLVRDPETWTLAEAIAAAGSVS